MITHTRSWSGRRRSVLSALVALGLAVPLLSGCGPTATTPNVVGMRLNAAHQALEKVDLKKFDDADVIGPGRSIFVDHNWVVLAQSPAAGTSGVDTDTTIKLSVGKVDDSEILGRLPADAPVILELAAEEEKARDAQAAKDAAEAARKAEQIRQDALTKAADQAAKAKEISDYAAKIDKLGLGVDAVTKLYDQNAAFVSEHGGSVTAAGNALAAKRFFESARDGFVRALPPYGFKLEGVSTDMAMAMGTMVDACDALLMAIDTGAPSAFARAKQDRSSAHVQWLTSLDRIHTAVDRNPPPAKS